MDKKIEKYNTILKEYLDIVPQENKKLYEELANMAINIGYVPIRHKTKIIAISFRNNKTKSTIMKFCEVIKDGLFRLKFSANKNYSKIFDESIKKYDDIIREKYSVKYNMKDNFTCFGCKDCINKRELFYTINYDDGRKVKVCGEILFVPIHKLTKKIVEEAGNMIKIQHEKLIEK